MKVCCFSMPYNLEGIEDLVKDGLDNIHDDNLDFQFLAALPLICFAYQCQIMVPPGRATV